MFEEWMAHSDLYQHFLAKEQIFVSEAKLFLNDGHFATGQGNAIPLAMANALKLRIAIITHGKFCQFCPSHQEKQLNACQYFLHVINLVQAIMMLLKCLQANPCHLQRKLIKLILNLAKMILVYVGKVQKR